MCFYSAATPHYASLVSLEGHGELRRAVGTGIYEVRVRPEAVSGGAASLPCTWQLRMHILPEPKKKNICYVGEVVSKNKTHQKRNHLQRENENLRKIYMLISKLEEILHPDVISFHLPRILRIFGLKALRPHSPAPHFGA